MPSIDDVYKMAVFQQQGGQQQMSVYHFNTITAAYAGADFVTLATDLKELHRVTQSSNVLYRSWRAAQVRGTEVTPVPNECRTEGGQLFEGNYTTSTQGSDVTGDDLPHQCAAVITLNTSQIGRRRRGRVYPGGFKEGVQANGTWITTHVTALQNAWATFAAKYVGASATSPVFRLGVWSFRIATGCIRDPNPPYKHIQVDPPNLASAFQPVTGYVVRSTVFTQRRRVVGVGR